MLAETASHLLAQIEGDPLEGDQGVGGDESLVVDSGG